MKQGTSYVEKVTYQLETYYPENYPSENLRNRWLGWDEYLTVENYEARLEYWRTNKFIFPSMRFRVKKSTTTITDEYIE